MTLLRKSPVCEPITFATASGVPRRNQFTALFAAFRAEIDDPIGALDHLEIVLDHDDRISLLDQPLKQPNEQRDVVEMQAGGRLVEDEQTPRFVGSRRCR